MQDGFLHAVVLRRGESPMSIFGHPEVYICAPFRCTHRLNLGYLLVSSLMIGLVINLSFKARNPDLIRKEKVGSGCESQLRVPHRPNNTQQVRITMRRFTKLTHDDCSILNGACYQCGKGASATWFSSRMYRRSLITIASHPLQGSSASAEVMQSDKVINRGGYGNT